MRIAFTTPSLRRDGGVERITALLANALATDGHQIAMISRNRTTDDEQRLQKGIERYELYVPVGPKALRSGQLPFVVASLRTSLNRFGPDVVIGSRWDGAILSLLASVGRSAPVIAWEHGYLPYAALTRPWKALRALTYPNAAAVVLVNEGSRADAETLIDPQRVFVIHNFVVADAGDAGATSDGSTLWATFPGGRPKHGLVGVGRLEREKGFDLLLEAYARVAESFPDWGLLIVGRGSLHAALQTLVARLDLKRHVHLAGASEDPTATLADSDAFVLPSRHEGFGIALIEAMSVGLPVVAFDCPGGPREIVRHGVDGLLVPNGDVDALAEGLAEVMSDSVGRQAMAHEARGVQQRFSEERALAAWSALLERVVQSQPPVDESTRRC